MGDKWVHMPKNTDRLESIEVLINENGMEGLFIQYNGVHVDRLHEFYKLKEDARYFSLKAFGNYEDERFTFTDSHGRTVDHSSPDSVFFSFETTDDEELRNMIDYISECCCNEDLQLDMTAYVGNKRFDIVLVEDGVDYISHNNGDRGINDAKIDELMAAVSESKKPSNVR